MTFASRIGGGPMAIDEKTGFGLTLTLVGMGLTFLTLGILAVSMHILKKLFPPESGTKKGKTND